MRWLGVILFLSFFFIPIASADTYLYCVDSDNGQTAGTAGHVDYSQVSIPQPHEITQVNDSCQTASLLTEYYCGGSNPVWTVNSSTIDCVAQGYTGCSNGACYGSATCSDGIRNGQETDVDCGGFTCNPCSGGQTCSISSDCESSVCNGGVCLDLPQEPVAQIDVRIGPLHPGDHLWDFDDNYNNTMMQLVLGARNGTARVEIITIHASGTGNDLEGIKKVYLAEDMDLNGRYTPNEYQWASGTYNHDNGEFSMRFMPTLELEAGESVTLLIVYEMKPTVSAGQTFTLQVGNVFARTTNGTYIGRALGTNSSFRVTKTIETHTPIDLCNNNGVRDFDEVGVDCGGAYCPSCPYIDHCVNGVRDSDEENVDCGGSCPTCIPNVCIPAEECSPLNPPLCDAASHSVSICISGFWSNVQGGYDLYCDDPGVCTPGTFLCNHQQRGVRECLRDGQWGEEVVLDSLYDMHCSNTDCGAGETYCFENNFYECRENAWERNAGLDATCQEQACEWGQMMCDFARETVTQCDLRNPLDPSSAYWHTLETQIVPADEEGPEQRFDPFDLYCLPHITLCDERSQRCDFEQKVVQTCVEGAWESSDNAPLYEVMCAGRECNPEEFLCNPFEENVAFCTQEGLWNDPSEAEYIRLCESSDLNPGVNDTTGIPFATGGKRTIVGVWRNNTVIAYRFLGPAPETLREMRSLPLSSWLPWVLVVILMGATLYFGLKYRACTFGTDIARKNKKTR